jgi:hypothetical protein
MFGLKDLQRKCATTKDGHLKELALCSSLNFPGQSTFYVRKSRVKLDGNSLEISAIRE